MKKKISSLLIMGLSTIVLSFSYLLINQQNNQAKKVDALEDNNIIYLDVTYYPAAFSQYLHCAVNDGDGHSYDVEMKKVPNYDTNHIYRLTLPKEYTYTTVYFYSLWEEGTELINGETPSLTIPTDKKI